MAQSNLMLSAMIFVLSWIVFFGISRLMRMKLSVRLVTVALLSLAAASHQLLVYYGGLHVLAVPHFFFYATTFATNLLFFAAPIAGIIYLVVFVRWVVRKSKHKLKAHYRVSAHSTRLGRAYSKLRYQLARSKVKERLQRRKAFVQAQAARRAAQELEHLATSQNSLEKNRAIQAEHDQLRTVGTITWSSGDADKITYSDGTGNSTVIDTRIYDQHSYRSDLKTNTAASADARALANSLFGGESDFSDQCTDFDPKTLPGNVEIIASAEDLQRLDAKLNNATNQQQTLMQVAAAARATGKRLEHGKLRALVDKAKSAFSHHEQGSSYYQELAQRAIEFGMQDEQELSHDQRFVAAHPQSKVGFWAKLPWRTIGTACALGCLIVLNAVAAFSTIQALNMPQIKYVDVTLDVPVEFEGLQIVQLLCELFVPGLQSVALCVQGGSLRALTLVFGVASQNVLLLADQGACGDWLLRRIRVVGKLLCVFFFLVGDLSDGVATVVQVGFLRLQFVQTRADADDLQQNVGLFPCGRGHELRQVDGEFLDKFVQQLLPGSLSGGVGDLKIAVFALAFDL